MIVEDAYIGCEDSVFNLIMTRSRGFQPATADRSQNAFFRTESLGRSAVRVKMTIRENLRAGTHRDSSLKTSLTLFRRHTTEPTRGDRILNEYRQN